VFLGAHYRSEAQLITDSQGKLMTIEVKRKDLKSLQGKDKSSASPFSSNNLKFKGVKSAKRPSGFVLGAATRYSERPANDYAFMKIRRIQDQRIFFQSEAAWLNINLPWNKSWTAYAGPKMINLGIRSASNGGYFDSKNRELNSIWVKLAPTTQTPDGIKGHIESPKFDRKERKIWNN
jgi:hypothetical protein